MQSRMELQIGKWGNSLGIRLPRHITNLLHLAVKDRIHCSVQDGKLVLEPIRQTKYTLEELLAKMEDTSEEISWGNPQGNEDTSEEISWGNPQGKEIW